MPLRCKNGVMQNVPRRERNLWPAQCVGAQAGRLVGTLDEQAIFGGDLSTILDTPRVGFSSGDFPTLPPDLFGDERFGSLTSVRPGVQFASIFDDFFQSRLGLGVDRVNAALGGTFSREVVGRSLNFPVVRGSRDDPRGLLGPARKSLLPSLPALGDWLPLVA